MRLSRVLALLCVLPVSACAHGASHRSSPTSATTRHLEAGVASLEQGRCEEAIREGFEPALASYRAAHRWAPLRVDRAQSSIGALANADDASRASDALAYTDALYLEAVCYVALGELDAAERKLAEALAIAPDDVVYLCELGHVYQRTERWPLALDAFDRALASVESLERRGGAHADVLGQPLVQWRARALRGVGFTLVELGELDEAASVYAQVLRLDPRDAQASAEARLIDARRQNRL